MPPPKSIIDIVKELQQLRETIATRIPSKDDPDVLVRDANAFNAKLVQHFPSIAQALLARDAALSIAVEALERQQEQARDPNKYGHIMVLEMKNTGDDALSRIRSLPMHGS